MGINFRSDLIGLDAEGVGFKSQRSTTSVQNHFECDFLATLPQVCIQHDELVCDQYPVKPRNCDR